jgi:hypothetical protein
MVGYDVAAKWAPLIDKMWLWGGGVRWQPSGGRSGNQVEMARWPLVDVVWTWHVTGRVVVVLTWHGREGCVVPWHVVAQGPEQWFTVARVLGINTADM